MNIELFIIFCLFLAAACGPHSLVFLSTGHLNPQVQPAFEQLTVFDGVAISFCDGSTKREQFKPTLQTKQLPEECNGAYVDILESIHNIQEHVNGTVYVVQRRRGCTQSADGTVSGFEAWAVNGIEFLTFNPESKSWTSRSPSALRVQNLWNQDNAKNFAFGHFIKYQCPVVMRKIKLTPVSKSTEVRIFAKLTSKTDEVLLRCHVMSSDKSVSSVQLIGNGAPNVNWMSMTGPLPSGNGSVVLRLTAEVSVREVVNIYGCTVQSESCNITVFWDGNTLEGRPLDVKNGLSRLAILIIGFFSVCFVMILMAQLVICLHTCVKLKHRTPSRSVDPELLEQLNQLIGGDVSPETRNILVSLVYDANFPEEYANCHSDWEEMKRLKDQMYYDPEFFANQTQHYNWSVH